MLMKRGALFFAHILLCLLIIVTATGCAKGDKGIMPDSDPPSPPEKQLALPLPVSAEFEERLAALTPYIPPLGPPHYYGGNVGYFIPSKEYGRVYPFVGQILESKEERADFWLPTSYLYGFVDEKGQIVCDPVYYDAILLRSGNKGAYVVEKRSLKHRVDNNDRNFTGDFPYMDWWMAVDSELEEYAAVISLDGSFFGQYDAVYTGDYWYSYGIGELKIAEYDYIAVCKDGLWGVIDYDGTEILPCQYLNAPLFSEGLAAVFFEDYKNKINQSVYTGYYYIDSLGNKVLGPYRITMNTHISSTLLSKLVFSHGRAINTNGYLYGFIDKYGNLVVPQIYAYFSGAKRYDNNGLAVVTVMASNKEGSEFYESSAVCGIIDIDGNYIAPLKSLKNYLHNYQEGDYYFLGYHGIEGEKDNEAVIKNKEGKTINANSSYIYRRCLEGDIFTTNSGIVNIKTGEVYYKGETPYVIRNVFLKPFYGTPFGGGDIINLDGRPCVLGYLCKEPIYERGFYKYDYNEPIKFGVLDARGPVLDFEYDYLLWMDKYFCAVQGNYGGLLNPDGTWFFKVELQTNAIENIID